MDRKVSVVVSVYNEEKALKEFYRETGKVLAGLDWDYELVFVNDGSSDGSLEILEELAEENPKVKIVSFSRNFPESSLAALSSIFISFRSMESSIS